MNSKLLVRKAITSGITLTLIATYSLVAFANSGKAIGELIVTGNNTIGEGAFVTVNGEAAKNGRSVFSASTITTPDGIWGDRQSWVKQEKSSWRRNRP